MSAAKALLSAGLTGWRAYDQSQPFVLLKSNLSVSYLLRAIYLPANDKVSAQMGRSKAEAHLSAGLTGSRKPLFAAEFLP